MADRSIKAAEAGEGEAGHKRGWAKEGKTSSRRELHVRTKLMRALQKVSLL